MSLLASCQKHNTVCCRECFPLPQWSDIVDVKDLEFERDKLRAEVKVSHDEYYRLEADRDKWKAEVKNVENCCFNHCILLKDRDLWKSKYEALNLGKTQYCVSCGTYARKAAKLAEALRIIESDKTEFGNPTWTANRAKEALAEFEKGEWMDENTSLTIIIVSFIIFLGWICR